MFFESLVVSLIVLILVVVVVVAAVLVVVVVSAATVRSSFYVPFVVEATGQLRKAALSLEELSSLLVHGRSSIVSQRILNKRIYL